MPTRRSGENQRTPGPFASGQVPKTAQVGQVANLPLLNIGKLVTCPTALSTWRLSFASVARDAPVLYNVWFTAKRQRDESAAGRLGGNWARASPCSKASNEV